MIDWGKAVAAMLKGNTIKETHLRVLPVIKDCPDWTKVEFIGRVDHKFTHMHYDGAVVRYKDAVYYLPKNIMDRLLNQRLIRKKWNTKKYLQVVKK